MPQATAEVLYGVLTAQLKSTFHKINVHAAMTPADIQKYFKPVFEQANALKEAFERRAQSEQQAATSQVRKMLIFAHILLLYIYCTRLISYIYSVHVYTVSEIQQVHVLRKRITYCLSVDTGCFARDQEKTVIRKTTDSFRYG